MLDVEAQEQFEISQLRGHRRLGHRELIVESTFAAAFLAVALVVALALPAVPGGPEFEPALAALLVIAYAVAGRVKLHFRTDYTTATQLLFVPMLFLLPLAAVPLLVAAGELLAELPEFVRRRRPAQRLLLALGNCWYAIGPVLVLAAFEVATPELADWPVLVAALGAQFLFDFGAQTLREWLGLGIAPRSQLADSLWIYGVDALLAPIGLLAAIETDDDRYLLLLTLPMLGLLAVFAKERNARIVSAQELRGAYRGTTILLAELLETDDEYTGFHSRDVVSLTLAVCTELGFDRHRRLRTEFGALLHDIGKIAVPKEILNKPGPLTGHEWQLIRLHTIEGQRMLERVGGLLSEIGRIVRSSHERWDGKGYPDGLAGEEIPLESRVVACCDAYNAMTTDRPYRRALSTEVALAELADNAGTQFDPEVAAAVIGVVRAAEGLPAQEPQPARRKLPGTASVPHPKG